MSDAPSLADLLTQLRTAHDRALAEMTDRMHHQDHRIAELMRRITALEASGSIRSGSFGGTIHRDSEPATITPEPG